MKVFPLNTFLYTVVWNAFVGELLVCEHKTSIKATAFLTKWVSLYGNYEVGWVAV